jgi:hypothetical protein
LRDAIRGHKRFARAVSRGLLAGGGLLGLCYTLTAGAALPVQGVVIPFHFRETVVSVDDTVPPGTVLGVAALPATPDMTCPGHETGGVLLGAGDLPWQGGTVDTGVPGVGARVVKDVTLGRIDGVAATLSLELVKTGPVSDGVIRNISGLPGWYLCPHVRSVPCWLVREDFRLQRPLIIRRVPLVVDPRVGRAPVHRVS